MKTLTVDQLVQARVCSKTIIQFRELFGNSVEVTETRAAEHSRVFSWAYAALKLLNNSACKEYHEIAEAAEARYEDAYATAKDDYDSVLTTEYDCVCKVTEDAAKSEYARTCATIQANYNPTCADAEIMRNRALAAAEIRCKSLCEAAWAQYDCVRKQQQTKCDHVCAAAWAEYERTCATTWARLYLASTDEKRPHERAYTPSW